MMFMMGSDNGGYCRSHQYEAARYLYLTRAKSVADRIGLLLWRIANGDQPAAEEKAIRLGDSTTCGDSPHV